MSKRNKFGCLTLHSIGNGKVYFQCDCGSETLVAFKQSTASSLSENRECDCHKRDKDGNILRNLSYYVGKRFGNLVCAGTKSGNYYFDCDCGNTGVKLTVETVMRRGEKASCGCILVKRGEFPAVKRESVVIPLSGNRKNSKNKIAYSNDPSSDYAKTKELETPFFSKPEKEKKTVTSCRNCKYDPTYQQQLEGHVCMNEKAREDENGNCNSKSVFKNIQWQGE